MDKNLLEILVVKPDLIADFPDWMLPQSTIHEMRETEHCAVAEIAGRDSIAAVLRACKLRTIRAIVPTVAYTGTEYGNWAITFEKIHILKDRLQKDNIRVCDPVVIGSPKFWWKLCGGI